MKNKIIGKLQWKVNATYFLESLGLFWGSTSKKYTERPNPRTQDVHWPYLWRLEDIQNVQDIQREVCGYI